LKNLILILSALVFSAVAHAGDASTYKALGYSRDNKLFAFAEVGTQDGSGFAYAKVSVVNVAANTILQSVAVQGDENSEITETQALATALRKADLARIGITGKNMGTDLLVRLPTDMSQYTDSVFSLEYWAQGGASTIVPKFAVVIEEKDAEKTPLCDSESKMIRVSIQGREMTDVKTLVLQDDQKQPSSRQCSYGYTVMGVNRNGQSLVVVIRYQRAGFEGPDYRYMVVTGAPELK
jgi:predicted secreted protein